MPPSQRHHRNLTLPRHCRPHPQAPRAGGSGGPYPTDAVLASLERAAAAAAEVRAAHEARAAAAAAAAAPAHRGGEEASTSSGHSHGAAGRAPAAAHSHDHHGHGHGGIGNGAVADEEAGPSASGESEYLSADPVSGSEPSSPTAARAAARRGSRLAGRASGGGDRDAPPGEAPQVIVGENKNGARFFYLVEPCR
jgi:hypothetical protein